MATFTGTSGLPSAFNGSGGTRQPGGLWRPWTRGEDSPGVDRARSSHGDQPLAKQPKTPPFVHPVRLFWPKSKCFDYLYRDAETLLRNYPVQATICVYEDSSSDEDSDEEEEEMEKELN
ncbi:protein ripply2 [Takifugu flavidus]|uniref:Protein ripply2 n=1 Tax=Takifugu flavidus TaxID=433684 RepID=A0A5C6NPR3_9TELE|nr:protein ripply2 [Takifugu flavidus]TWW68679.1 Protein ripply2 [Takifugu flavidus]